MEKNPTDYSANKAKGQMCLKDKVWANRKG
jgi:hypothetical protein